VNSRGDFGHSPDERREILLDSLSQCKQSQPIMAKYRDLILCLFFLFYQWLEIGAPTEPADGRSSQRSRARSA
jgi:hypothetical protein